MFRILANILYCAIGEPSLDLKLLNWKICSPKLEKEKTGRSSTFGSRLWKIENMAGIANAARITLFLFRIL